MKDYEDPNHPGNSSRYFTGKECATPGCVNSAGTVWSPHFCFKCNAENMRRSSAMLKAILEKRAIGNEAGKKGS